MHDPLQQALTERFGLPDFRPWQREAITALLEGSGRVLAIAPTGGGKSLCYQFPATELDGPTIVVSPLIALMEDQVRALEERGIAATYLASNLSMAERRERSRRLRSGELKLVYVAPERLKHEGVVRELRDLRPPLVAIDEAHCISQWGHDFRPDYLRLGQVVRALEAPRVLACTATATPDVREEILEKLELGPETIQILRGFARPNLHLVAEELDSASQRKKRMLQTITEALGTPSEPKGAVIVYAGTRKRTEETAALVGAQGWRSAGYHAGLAATERGRVSEAFAAGELDVVVATNAFGMGIDRADIRAVVHICAPGSIEAYYQEVGRGGRDGQPAVGLLLTGSADIGLRRRLIELPGRDGKPVPPARVEQQWKLFRDLLRYIEAGSCRHDFILRYFGDEQETLGGCGHCDVCERLERTGGVERTVGEEESTIVRKGLSGIARVRRRVGLVAIAKMLGGVEDKQLQRLRLDQLSTFGLLSDRSQAWIRALLRRLISAGLVDITTDRYPMPYLTGAGVRAMKGEIPIRVLPPHDDEVGSKKGRRGQSNKGGRRGVVDVKREPPAHMDAALFERLREVRMELAKERGVPAYVVCHDRTLMEIAADRPADLVALSDVAGMGPARIEAYGDRLLAIVNA